MTQGPFKSREESAGKGKLLSRALLGQAVGMGAVLAWCELVERPLYIISPQSPVSALGVASLTELVFLLLVTRILARGRVSLGDKGLRWLGMAAVVLGTLTALPVKLLLVGGLGGLALATVAGVCSVVALGACLRSVATMPSQARMVALIAAFLVASLVKLLVSQLVKTNTDLGIYDLQVLAVFALAGQWFCGELSAEAGKISYRPSSTQHYRVIAAAFIIYVFLFAASAGAAAFNRGDNVAATSEQGVVEALAVMVICAIILLVVLFSGRVLSLRAGGLVLTPILAVLFLSFIILPDSGRNYLPALTAAFWRIVQLYILLLLFDISSTGVASPALAFCVGWAVVCAGTAAGALFGQGMAVAFGKDVQVINALSIAYTLAAIVAMAMAFGGRYPDAALSQVLSGAGAKPEPEKTGAQQGLPVEGAEGLAGGQADKGAPADDGSDLVVKACQLVAHRYALSEREAEVCELLARGNTRAGIATRLVVSENTVRTHVKNLYTKLDVHSKQQLVDLIDSTKNELAA